MSWIWGGDTQPSATSSRFLGRNARWNRNHPNGLPQRAQWDAVTAAQIALCVIGMIGMAILAIIAAPAFGR